MMGYKRIKAIFSQNKYGEGFADYGEETLNENLNRFLRSNAPTELIEHLGIDKNKKQICLDMGCGTGWFEFVNAENYLNSVFIGLDSDREQVKFANRKKRRANMSFVVGEAERIPFKDNIIDSILAFDSFEHFVSPEKAVNEIKRTLKPKGKCLLTAPNKYGAGHLDYIHLNKIVKAHEFSYFQLTKMFRSAGLKYYFIPPKNVNANRFLKKMLIELFIKSNLWRIFKPSSFRIILEKQ